MSHLRCERDFLGVFALDDLTGFPVSTGQTGWLCWARKALLKPVSQGRNRCPVRGRHGKPSHRRSDLGSSWVSLIVIACTWARHWSTRSR